MKKLHLFFCLNWLNKFQGVCFCSINSKPPWFDDVPTSQDYQRRVPVTLMLHWDPQSCKLRLTWLVQSHQLLPDLIYQENHLQIRVLYKSGAGWEAAGWILGAWYLQLLKDWPLWGDFPSQHMSCLHKAHAWSVHWDLSPPNMHLWTQACMNPQLCMAERDGAAPASSSGPILPLAFLLSGFLEALWRAGHWFMY